MTPRRPYTPPAVESLGAVYDLTLGATPGSGDSQSPELTLARNSGRGSRGSGGGPTGSRG